MSGVDPRAFDVPVLIAGGVAAGGLAVGLAVLAGSAAGSDPDLGPTAAALDEAFAQLVGAGAGLGVASAGIALVARRGPRPTTGALGALLGYLLVVAPVLMVTAPSDLSFRDLVETAAAAAILLLPLVLLGALIGSSLARRARRTDIGREH